jgi:transglutaminase-like putative cysteine protease
MGIYLRDQKAGWLRTSLRREALGGRETWVVEAEGRMSFVILDRRRSVQSSERTLYEAAAPHRLLSHESSVSTGDSSSRTEIRPSGEGFEVTVYRGGQKRARPAAFRHTLLDLLAAELLAAEGREPGFARPARIFLSDVPAEEEGRVRVEGFREAAGRGREACVGTESPRLRRRAWIGPDGSASEVRLGPGFALRAQPKAEAQALGAGADLSKLSVTGFLDRPLGAEPKRVRRLVLSVEGIPAADLPRDGRQSAEGEPGGSARLTIAREPPPPACARAPEETKPWLEADAELPADHPEILAVARRVAGREGDLHGRARLLCAWVHANLRRTPRSFLSSALDVLRKREGDCTEHALLAAALCRAAGVPARVVVGLAYAGDERRVFGFHAWIEAWCGRWTAMDPSWDEPLADATHLRLAEGSDPYALLPFLGEIRIRVIEVETDP